MLRILGNFASYIVDAVAAFEDDEAAIHEAIDEMLSMCGNAGQESLIGDYSEDFFNWATEVLESPSSRGTTFESFAAMVMNDWYGDAQKWQGSRDIWAEGWSMIARQSGYHDSTDEGGEGTGTVF